MRYQAKIPNPWRLMKATKAWTTTRAVRKATKHGVRLFEFRDWTTNVKDDFPATAMDAPPAEA